MNVGDLQLQIRLGRATEAPRRRERIARDADFADERRLLWKQTPRTASRQDFSMVRFRVWIPANARWPLCWAKNQEVRPCPCFSPCLCGGAYCSF